MSSPFEDIGGVDDAGAVHMLYSSPAGLRSADEMVHQNSRGIKGGAEYGDHFGRALAVGDFNGDREDDLAVGTPLEDIRDLADAGAVTVLYGSDRSGITRWDDFWHQGSPGIKGTVQAFDNFGLSIAAGDFDGDRRWDLVASAPRDSVQGYPEAGAVNVIYGDREGFARIPTSCGRRALAVSRAPPATIASAVRWAAERPGGDACAAACNGSDHSRSDRRRLSTDVTKCTAPTRPTAIEEGPAHASRYWRTSQHGSSPRRCWPAYCSPCWTAASPTR